ncbi:MutS-like protein [Paraburkholderia fungorum]|jgi:DNA mismatch repair ATPase MutS|uniref:MutS-related protein n=1 Tax=Paraburkholderia fungorum TaxID=134537 RepID=UPI000D0488AB|nr:DNA mismatch repair protein MutS [Paraburkholderia fungorum]PRZ46768.1 MutS-like protein [Paraburkholderia fungorum]
MTFDSILFRDARATDVIDGASEPEIFGDLNLDQIIDSITHGRDDYNLKPFFYVPLTDVDSVSYRHEILHDLERDEVVTCINAFAAQMRAMRVQLAAATKLYFRWQKRRYFLDGAQIYCAAIDALARDLEAAVPHSSGLVAFLDYLRAYANGHKFQVTKQEEARIRDALAQVRYSILIKGNAVTVRKYAGEIDYSEDVQKTFEKFKQGKVKSHSTDMRDSPDMDHVEANVLDFVARLHPEVFGPLEDFCSAHASFLDPVIERFDREVQFYVAYLEHIARLKGTGLSFCYPQMLDTSKEIRSIEGFDLALAEKLRREEARIVCNDFYLEGSERIIVVTGPNQGGKTTFSRTFGQLHYLAAIGWPVPGREARLFLFDQIFTHFERQEDMKNLRGKLHDDLYRIHRILGRATTRSIIIMNEIFSSTSLKDALYLSEKVMGRIMNLDALCVYVTFIEELSRLSVQTVSMLSEVQHDAIASRTFKVLRRPADGRSYALSLARQYQLTYDQLTERIGS